MPGPYNPNYQVQTDDKDLLTLSEKLNVPYQDLTNANPNINSISEGQYITVPTPQATFTGSTKHKNLTAPTGSFIASGGTVALGVNQTTKKQTPTVAPLPVLPPNSTIYDPVYVRQQANAFNPAAQGANSFTSGNPATPANVAQTQYNINNQVANGVLPNSVPQGTYIINPSTGKPASEQEMMSNGYVYNNYTKQWELGGTGQPPGTPVTQQQQAAETPAYLQNVNYNGQTMPAWKAELYAKRAARKGRERAERAQALAQQEQLRSDTGSTTLSIRLGS